MVRSHTDAKIKVEASGGRTYTTNRLTFTANAVCNYAVKLAREF